MLHALRPQVLALAYALAPAALAGSTWHVDVHASAPGDGSLAAPFTSLQYAIDRPAVLDGDTLLVAPGTYVENLVLADRDLTLVSTDGPTRTTIRAAGPGDVVTVSAPVSRLVTIEGFTLEGGQGANDDGLHVLALAFVFLRECIVARNAGAGVHTDYDVSIEECTITDNGVGVQSTTVGAVWMKDSIVWDNDDCIQLNPSFHFLQWSDVPCDSLVSNSINADPLFADAAHGDYALLSGSPCIDAGEPGTTDADGSRVDMGALDHDPAHVPDLEQFCATSPNAVGAGAVIGAIGTTSSSADDLTLFVRGAPPQQVGVFFHGSAPSAAPFVGGTLCVGGSVVRLLPALGIGPGGSAARALVQGAPDALAFAPGSTRYVQFWYRDPGAPHGTGSNLSDGLVVRTRP
ncbi:MAG: hypothetical protein KDC14_07035 [Planctomycetes bacterium]|nr:hypothetical protein [Planctomycetota bacterium]